MACIAAEWCSLCAIMKSLPVLSSSILYLLQQSSMLWEQACIRFHVTLLDSTSYSCCMLVTKQHAVGVIRHRGQTHSLTPYTPH